MITTSDLLRVSVRQMLRQRSVGVILSIALGITAFISLFVLGGEMRHNIGKDMVLMGGVNIIEVILNDREYVGQPRREFYSETVEAIRALPGVAAVSVSMYSYQDILFRKGDKAKVAVFLGVDEYYWETFAAECLAGRLLNSEDVNSHRRVCVIGWELANSQFQNAQNALGQTFLHGGNLFEVVGVVGGIMLGSGSRGGFFPYTTMVDRNMGGGKANRLYVRATTWEDVPILAESFSSVIQEKQNAPYLLIRTRAEQLTRISGLFLFVEVLLWLGIATSLMLGGFGIWYGTFSAVRARTREVGLKKAMGGADRDILAQFLTEALCKSVAGGVVGIVLGTITVEVGSYALGSSVSYEALMLSSVGSIIFSAVIGVAGGLYPALKASRMDVVTALRFE